MANKRPEIIAKLTALRDAHILNTRDVKKRAEIINIFDEILSKANYLLSGGNVDEIINNWYNDDESYGDLLFVYQIMSENDEKTCLLCTAANGLVLLSELRVPGYTAPPFHPNCRCTIHEWRQTSPINSLPGWQKTKSLGPPYTPSDEIIAFIASYESFSASAYYASPGERERGIRTIGYGHKILPEEVHRYPDGYVMSREEALELFARDIQSFVDEMNEAFDSEDITLTQNQFDACLSFFFNTGKLMSTDWWGSFKSGGDAEDILDGFLQYTRSGDDHLKGLYRRRVDEWEIFIGMGYERNYNRETPEGFI